MASNTSWSKIFKDYGIDKHDFDKNPFQLSAEQIKRSCQNFTRTAEKEVRILCKQDTRESRPEIFIMNNLFLLPVRNGLYSIIRGEGYFEIPEISSEIQEYDSSLKFKLDTSTVGDSEMQHLDFAYATSLIRTFVNDKSLLLTIRGRKYTPKFDFFAGKHKIEVESVQTEVDAGYEGKDKVVLIEAKRSGQDNTIIRQLYYPFRQWKSHTEKEVLTLFFERDTSENTYSMWNFKFNNVEDYNSIELVKSEKYKITR